MQRVPRVTVLMRSFRSVVKYIDDKGATKEKWSYAWFTKREAQFLEQKKIITIVPYKNTYGILEEMQY